MGKAEWVGIVDRLVRGRELGAVGSVADILSKWSFRILLVPTFPSLLAVRWRTVATTAS